LKFRLEQITIATVSISSCKPFNIFVITVSGAEFVLIQNVFVSFLFVIIKDFPVDLRLETLMIINNYAELSGFIGSCLICVWAS
jgi:hypothetical protein